MGMLCRDASFNSAGHALATAPVTGTFLSCGHGCLSHWVNMDAHIVRDIGHGACQAPLRARFFEQNRPSSIQPLRP